MLVSLDPQFCSDLIRCFGHFLWQATLIGFVFWIAMRAIPSARSDIRYWIGVVCLIVLAGCVPTTFAMRNNANSRLAVISADEANVPNSSVMIPEPRNDSIANIDSLKIEQAKSSKMPNPSTADNLAQVSGSVDSISRWLVGFYFCGVGLLLMRLAIGIRTGWSFHRGSAPVADRQWLRILDHAMQQVGVTVAPPIRICRQILQMKEMGLKIRLD